LDWSRPTCVAFGEGAPVIEMEMAYQVYDTLQSAAGREMRLCGTADIPKEMLENGNLVLVGTPGTNSLVSQVSPKLTAGKGTIILHEDRHLLLTGDTADGVRAAATEFVLRYWPHAKDSTSRISGLEKGAALGNKASPVFYRPPITRSSLTRTWSGSSPLFRTCSSFTTTMRTSSPSPSAWWRPASRS
jgi:hypothetical protein